MIVAVLTVAVVALTVALVVALVRQRRAVTVHAVLVPLGATEECSAPGCGIEMPLDDAHLLVATFDEPEFGMGAGTAMSAAYCADHCPGGCNREKEHAR